METAGSPMAARINMLIRTGEFGISLDETPFLCECPQPHCHAAVWLAPEEFDLFRDEGQAILAPEHDSGEPATTSAVIPLSTTVGSIVDQRLAS